MSKELYSINLGYHDSLQHFGVKGMKWGKSLFGGGGGGSDITAEELRAQREQEANQSTQPTAQMNIQNGLNTLSSNIQNNVKQAVKSKVTNEVSDRLRKRLDAAKQSVKDKIGGGGITVTHDTQIGKRFTEPGQKTEITKKTTAGKALAGNTLNLGNGKTVTFDEAQIGHQTNKPSSQSNNQKPKTSLKDTAKNLVKAADDKIGISAKKQYDNDEYAYYIAARNKGTDGTAPDSYNRKEQAAYNKVTDSINKYDQTLLGKAEKRLNRDRDRVYKSWAEANGHQLYKKDRNYDMRKKNSGE